MSDLSVNMPESSASSKNLVEPAALVRSAAALCVFMIHAMVLSSVSGFTATEHTWFLEAPGHMAVWIFFFISGYYNIWGFMGEKPRYTLDAAGIKSFYIRRFLKVILPVWCFDLIALTISEPSFVAADPGVIIRILTCTYFSEPGCASVAATWYVSTLTWLYVCTPAIAFVLRKVYMKSAGRAADAASDASGEAQKPGGEKQAGHTGSGMLMGMIIVMLTTGLILRLVLLRLGVDWTKWVFVPFYTNLDVYVTGALTALLAGNKDRKRLLSGRGAYIASVILTAALFLAAARIYYLKAYSGSYLIFYEYILPTVSAIVMICVFLMADDAGYGYQKAAVCHLWKNPLRIIDLFSYISFEFYLVHSMILFHLVPFFANGTVAGHLKLLGWGFVLSCAIALLFRRATDFGALTGRR